MVMEEFNGPSLLVMTYLTAKRLGESKTPLFESRHEGDVVGNRGPAVAPLAVSFADKAPLAALLGQRIVRHRVWRDDHLEASGLRRVHGLAPRCLRPSLRSRPPSGPRRPAG